jgi:hypothetical protein
MPAHRGRFETDFSYEKTRLTGETGRLFATPGRNI